MFRHGVYPARLVVAALLITSLLLAQSAYAEDSFQFSRVPQKLLLRFLADNETFTLVDARSSAEFKTSRINGAINVPHDSTDEVLSSLPSKLNAPIVVYCKTGKRATQLQTKLLERGFTNVRVLLPEQIVWFDGMAVFNCGAPATGESDKTFAKLINEGNREGKL